MCNRKRIAALLTGLLVILSCSTFHVTKEIKNGSALSKLKNTGILFRTPHNSTIPVSMLNTNIGNWIEPFKKINNLKIITGTSSKLNRFASESERFLQFSSNNDFQMYQTLGIITHYLGTSKEELDKIVADNGLDSLIIYEVDSTISPELQFTDFGSMIVVVNAKYQVIYMDRQYDKYEENELDRQILQENLLDHISNRLMDFLMKYDYIKEN
jgi:hypothetical protein